MAPQHSVSGFVRGQVGTSVSPSRRLYEPEVGRHDQTTQAGRLCPMKKTHKNDF